MGERPPRGFGLPRRDDGESGGSNGPIGPGGPGGAGEPGGTGGAPDEDLTLSIRGVRARGTEDAGEMEVELDTTRGAITLFLRPVEGKTGVAIFMGGAAGGVEGPADRVFVRLSQGLAEDGVTSVRLQWREAGEFEECLMDALAACSFVKGIGAERVVLVGHSFGGAVAVKAAPLASITAGVASLAAQRYGTFEVEELGRPLLLIHGTEDEVLDHAASEDIHQRAREPKRLVLLEGAGHGFAGQAQEVYDLLREFILEHAGER
jgi:alpha/beta superfamily hydrolase